MSIPLDRLYQYIEHIIGEVFGNVIIYHFWPHGSKNVENLFPLHGDEINWYDSMISPAVVCNDQEPLDYGFYTNNFDQSNLFFQLTQKYACKIPTNLEKHSIFDKTVVLHSEKNSLEVDKYANDDRFITAYYWCHAVISLDWFRFANYLEQKKTVKKNFLIYNRSWAGTREYRIKFIEQLIKLDLAQHCQTTFNPVDPDTELHYSDHAFKNHIWKPDQNVDAVFATNEFTSGASADFVLQDYEQTDIEVVLETLFDDPRIHLTEKSLRPIACGQPFILAGGPGSLSYLRDYGFATFETVWNEDYDKISDPSKRLQAITALMKTIADWDPQTKMHKLAQARAIADHNKKYFFSESFFNLVVDELKTNVNSALIQLVQDNTSSRFFQYRKEYAQHQELKKIILGRVPHPSVQHLPIESIRKKTYFNTGELIKVLQEARKYNKRNYP